MPIKLKHKVWNRSYYDHDAQWASNGPGEPKPANHPAVLAYDASRNTSNNLPDWWDRLHHHGGDCTTFLDGDDYDLSVKDHYIEYWYQSPPPVGNVWFFGHKLFFGPGTVQPIPFPGLPTASASEINSLSNQASIKAANQAREILTTFQGGTFVGEIGEVLHMLRHPAQGLRKGLSNHLNQLASAKKKLKGATRQSKLKYLSDAWLENVFGWQPLIHDINDAAEALTDLATTHVRRVSGFASTESVLSDSTSQQISGIVHWVQRTRVKGRISVSVRSGVIVKVDTPRYMSAQNLGFSWDTWVPTLWELTPYSFLVDYFTNIGDVISAWSVPSGSFLWGSHTLRYTSDFEIACVESKRDPLPAGWSFKNPPIVSLGSAKGQRRHVTRTSWDGNTFIPQFEVRIPNMGSLKWLNMAALGAQHRRLTPY